MISKFLAIADEYDTVWANYNLDETDFFMNNSIKLGFAIDYGRYTTAAIKYLLRSSYMLYKKLFFLD